MIKKDSVGVVAHAHLLLMRQVEFSEDLETVGEEALAYCPRLIRVAIPLLRDYMVAVDVFRGCDALSQVDLIGGIRKTISSLLIESWKDDVNDIIDFFNQSLPTCPVSLKTEKFLFWIERIFQKIEHYKAEHYALLKEAISLLELALWKANLIKNDKEEGEHSAKKAKIADECGDTSAKSAGIWKEGKSEVDATRRAAHVMCGADIIIKNVLPFLNDGDEFPLINHEAS